MEKKKLGEIIGIVITVIVVLAGIYYYWQSRKSAELNSQAVTESATQGTLPSIGEAGNPLSSKPDLNPADKANPFDSIKTNPFE